MDRKKVFDNVWHVFAEFILLMILAILISELAVARSMTFSLFLTGATSLFLGFIIVHLARRSSIFESVIAAFLFVVTALGSIPVLCDSGKNFCSLEAIELIGIVAFTSLPFVMGAALNELKLGGFSLKKKGFSRRIGAAAGV